MIELFVVAIIIVYAFIGLTAYNYLEAYIHVYSVKPNWWHVLAVFTPFNLLLVIYISIRRIWNSIPIFKQNIINFPKELFNKE